MQENPLEPAFHAYGRALAKFIESGAVNAGTRERPSWFPAPWVFEHPSRKSDYVDKCVFIFQDLSDRLEAAPNFHNKVYFLEKLGLAWSAFEFVVGKPNGKIPSNDPVNGDTVNTFTSKFDYVLSNLGKVYCTTFSPIPTH